MEWARLPKANQLKLKKRENPKSIPPPADRLLQTSLKAYVVVSQWCFVQFTTTLFAMTLHIDATASTSQTLRKAERDAIHQAYAKAPMVDDSEVRDYQLLYFFIFFTMCSYHPPCPLCRYVQFRTLPRSLRSQVQLMNVQSRRSLRPGRIPPLRRG